MSESIEQPGDFHIQAQVVAAIGFAVLHLSDEELTARFDIVGHDIHPADDLEPTLGDKFAKRCGFFRIAFQEGLEIGDLIQGKFVFGVLFQKLNGLQNVDQTHFQILLACFEDRTLPVRVGNVI